MRRCLALAAALARTGASCTFVVRALPGNVNRLVEQSGHRLTELSATAADPETDAAETIAAAASSVDLTIVDHYGLDLTWEWALRRISPRIAVVDDLADRPHDCDVLTDATGGSDRITRYEALIPADALLLLGPRYALLRPEFQAERARLRKRTGCIRRILISFGAIDPGNHSEAAWRAVRSSTARDAEIDIAIGGDAPNRAHLERAIQGDPLTRLCIDTNDMAGLMAAADLAIGAGGTTSWERACLGLPALVTMIADNQRDNVLGLVDAGAAISVPPGAAFAARLTEAISALCSDPERVSRMSTAAAKLVDGRGADRLAKILARPKLTLRAARPDDSRQIWQWRNDPFVRSASLDPTPIPWEEHRAWIDAALASTDHCLLIGEADGLAVGVLRFDLSGTEARVSFYLTPEGRGRGIGPELLTQASAWLRSNRPHVIRIKAQIQPNNFASIAAFSAARYRPAKDCYVRDLSHDDAKTL